MSTTTYTINEQVYQRIPYGDEFAEEVQERCHDCHVEIGEYHIPGCDNEICPKCEGQCISCDCTMYDYFEVKDHEGTTYQFDESRGYNNFYIYGCQTDPGKEEAEWIFLDKIPLDSLEDEDGFDTDEIDIQRFLAMDYTWLIVSSEPQENM